MPTTIAACLKVHESLSKPLSLSLSLSLSLATHNLERHFLPCHIEESCRVGHPTNKPSPNSSKTQDPHCPYFLTHPKADFPSLKKMWINTQFFKKKNQITQTTIALSILCLCVHNVSGKNSSHERTPNKTKPRHRKSRKQIHPTQIPPLPLRLNTWGRGKKHKTKGRKEAGTWSWVSHFFSGGVNQAMILLVVLFFFFFFFSSLLLLSGPQTIFDFVALGACVVVVVVVSSRGRRWAITSSESEDACACARGRARVQQSSGPSGRRRSPYPTKAGRQAFLVPLPRGWNGGTFHPFHKID